jgi:hypothetical protein
MKISRQVVGALSVLAALAVPSLWPPTALPTGGPDAPARLEEVLSIGSLEDDLLLMWVGLAVDRDGNLFVSDGMDYSIKRLDRRGILTRKAGRAGGGPGEFQAVREVALAGERLYVTDQFRPQLSVFDRELGFQKTIPLTRVLTSLRGLPDGTLAAVGLSFVPDERPVIWLSDSQGRVLREIPFGSKPSFFAGGMASLGLAGEDFVLAYHYRDRVERLDRDGKTLWSKDLFHFKEAEVENISGLKVGTSLVYKDVGVDRTGRIYVLGGSQARHPSRDVYVLDRNGRLEATLVLPDTTHAIFLDDRGFLYSRANEGVTIKKFRVRLPGQARGDAWPKGLP